MPDPLVPRDDGVLAMMGEPPDLARIPVMVLTSCRDPNVLNGVAGFPIRDYHAIAMKQGDDCA